jgi:hypothetical protein
MATRTPRYALSAETRKGALSPFPAKDLAESINELDRLIGTRDFTSRLPLQLRLASLAFEERETARLV